MYTFVAREATTRRDEYEPHAHPFLEADRPALREATCAAAV